MEHQDTPYAPPLSVVGDRAPLSAPMLVGGGFIRRLAAYIVDCTILAVALVALSMVLALAMGKWGEALVNVLGFFITIGYFSYMESSEAQATLGKRFLGLRVVDQHGDRLTWLHALGRYVAAAVNWLVFGLGYLVIAFHPEKKGLHDMIASTQVVLDDPSDTAVPPRAWVIVGLAVIGWILLVLLAIFLALAVGGMH